MEGTINDNLKCSCGQPITRRDVMQQGVYSRPDSGDSIYIRSRCSRCKKLSEHFVKMDEWMDSLLLDVPAK